jgi:hypothetical protein
MSYRDEHVIAWKSFEIGDGILYTEDDVKKTPSSLGLVVHESFILTSKEEGIMTRKKTENVNEDTIGSEIVTSDQLVNAMQGTFSYAQPRCTTHCIYFVKRAIGDQSLLIPFFLSFFSIKRR